MTAAARKLTRNQALVLDCLQQGERAMSAYELLDALRAEGLRAPVQVYRALDALGQRHLVHRIESLNAFVACAHHGPAEVGTHSEAAGFAICDDCGGVAEFDLPLATRELRAAAADRSGFETRHMTVELHGRCADCGGGDAGAAPEDAKKGADS